MTPEALGSLIVGARYVLLLYLESSWLPTCLTNITQMVGQGIFRVYQQGRPRRSFRSLLSGAPVDSRDDPASWTSLVARSILYRVRQPSNFKELGQSGTPVCVVENLPNNAGKIAKVAGFSSFVQMSSDSQRFDLEGERLYKRLEEGRVAFYGAFQVPPELRDGYQIV